MLSEGEWYKEIPKDPLLNEHWRVALRALCRERRMQEWCKAICKRDILFYVNSFVYQYNPQHFGGEIGPFITWPVQDEAIKKILWCIEHRKDMRVAKSREMGASWMFLIVMDWLYQFHGNKKFLMISRNKEAVDKRDDSDSLFWKIDFMHAHLPSWLAPKERRRPMSFTLEGHYAGITG